MTDIPASMKPWHGGEGPPHDWNREQAMRRDGQLEMARDIMQAQWWGSNDDWDIIAYTPKPPAGGDAGASFVDRVCEVLRKEQDRLDAEGGDYLMDTSDCINVIRENAAALALPAPVVEGERFANDEAAKALYDTWSNQPGWVPWVERGNSAMQERARREVTL